MRADLSHGGLLTALWGIGGAQKTLQGRSRMTDPEVLLSGDVLVSHTVPRAVPSALKGLTSGFGMEPGVSLSP